MPERQCSVRDCGRKHHARGLCPGHYRRLEQSGDVMPNTPLRVVKITPGTLCAIGDCSEPYYCNGLCHRHHDRTRTLAKYGLSVEEYESLLAQQDGRCAICRTDDPKGPAGSLFPVDHDHLTGLVRGLLCQTCNQTLGLMADSPDLLRAAADYLSR